MAEISLHFCAEINCEDGKSLGLYYAPKRSDANGLSFVGAKYDAAIVARVKITCGNGALGVGVHARRSAFNINHCN